MSDKAILHKYVAQNEHTTSNGKNGIESKTEQIYQAILGMIRDGSFRSGDKLPNERAMADQFHCSRAIVRDALLRVQSEGLVVRKVGSGTYVSAKAPQLIETRDAQVELISDTPPIPEHFLKSP